MVSLTKRLAQGESKEALIVIARTSTEMSGVVDFGYYSNCQK